MNRAGELSPDQIRNLTVSFAQLGYFNTQFKSIMADAIIEKLDQFDPAVLADTAWAFGEAQYYDYDLLSTLMPYLKSNIQKFDASGMAKVRSSSSMQAADADGVVNNAMTSLPAPMCPTGHGCTRRSVGITASTKLLYRCSQQSSHRLLLCLAPTFAFATLQASTRMYAAAPTASVLPADAVDVCALWLPGRDADGHDARHCTEAAGQLQQQDAG
jgi:hypothetical protein